MNTYKVNGTSLYVSVQLLPADATDAIANQQQFGWYLDHTFTQTTIRGKLEFAVLVRVLDNELQSSIPIS